MPVAPKPPPMTGVILAGGKGSRFGGSKAGLRCGGETFVERTGRVLRELFGRVIIVGGPVGVPFRSRFADCIHDEIDGIGPMGGLHAALRHIATEHAFVVACDMPCLQTELIAAQARAAWGADVVVPRHNGLLEPLHAVYGKGCLPAIERQIGLGDYRLRSIFGQVRTVYMDLSPWPLFREAFTNINTPADLRIRQ